MTDLDDLASARTPQRRAYLEGQQAAALGKELSDNPYPSETVAFFARVWESGYRAYIHTHPRGMVSTAWAGMCINPPGERAA